MDRYDVFAGFIALVLVALGLIAVWTFNSAQCTAKWSDSGFRHRWSIMAGCVVETEPGRWVPEERVRDIAPGAAP